VRNEMRFGYFDDKNLEYVISQPDTPLPWINFLGMENYFGIISNTAGGYSFYRDARLRRLTRYRYNNAPLDEGGRYIYIRDNQNHHPDFWSPTWQPTKSVLDYYECRHGLGYTTIKSIKNEIETQIKYFVPQGENLEVWELQIKNNRSQDADLSLFSSVEFCLWDAVDDANNYQRNYSIGEVEILDNIIFHKSEYRERRNHFAYFACSEEISGFDTQRESFLGPYKGWDSPEVVERGMATDSIAHGWQPIGVHQVNLVLQAGETRKIIFLLGYHENPDDEKFEPSGSQTINKKTVLPIIQKFLQPEMVEKAFSELTQYWQSLLQKLQADTPDIHTNRMVNVWNAYQMMITFNFSRSASYFESGIGRGMGFRDSNQDLLGFTHLIPTRARERLLDLAATQLPNGGAYHQYQPLTKLGNNDIGSEFNDDPLWLVLAVSTYIKETGDFSILQEMVPYDNKPGSEATLLDHLHRCLEYTLARLGPHSLPLIGRADWNDCLNLNCFSDKPGQSFQTTTNKDGKVAESVFIAGLFILASKEMESILQRTNHEEESNRYATFRKQMETSIEEFGWDGKWFRRAYDNFGEPVGSDICDEGKIFIEPQGICVMAGVGIENRKAMQALDAVKQHLAFEHGIVLLAPAYQKYYIHLGEISSYPPGYKENGSVFCHTNPWIVIAETCIGRGDQAFEYYQRINPSYREEIGELHRCEPYVYAQMIAGKEAHTPGEAKNSWLTGTASWNYVAITQHILGIKPTFDGLQISPVIPGTWAGFTCKRHFRGCDYLITVQRSGPGNNVRLSVNGTSIGGTIVPLPTEGVKEMKITVVIE